MPNKNEAISIVGIEAALDKAALRYDRDGDEHYDVVSAFIKSLRGSDVDAALHLYRSGFKPSPRFPEPHAMVSASVIAAETTEEAEFLAGPSRIMALSLRTGRLGPIVSPETAATVELSDLDRSVLDQLPGTQYACTAEEVVAALDELAERTGADELMLAGTVYDPATRRDTLTRIAKAW